MALFSCKRQGNVECEDTEYVNDCLNTECNCIPFVSVIKKQYYNFKSFKTL